METLQQFHRRLTTQGPESFLENLLFYLLLPLSFLYGTLMWVRSILYRAGILSTSYSRIPVISVGNLAVGGTGKTPFVDYLLTYFKNKGFRPAVISRGYGGSFSGKLAVVSSGTGPLLNADYCGDEPCLLAKKHPQVVVLIAPRRRDAMNWINTEKNADVIILDDAFQHLQVGRDLNIVLLDATNPFGNGYPLPAGLLREFPGALSRADLLVLTRAELTAPVSLGHKIPTISCCHQISDQLESLDGKKITIGALAGKRGVAFAGIARPEAFFESLGQLGLDLVETCPFPDHEKYGAEVLGQLTAVKGHVDYFITTEKDAVKIAADALPAPCYVASLTIDLFEDAALKRCLDSICDRIKDADK